MEIRNIQRSVALLSMLLALGASGSLPAANTDDDDVGFEDKEGLLEDDEDSSEDGDVGFEDEKDLIEDDKGTSENEVTDDVDLGFGDEEGLLEDDEQGFFED